MRRLLKACISIICIIFIVSGCGYQSSYIELELISSIAEEVSKFENLEIELNAYDRKTNTGLKDNSTVDGRYIYYCTPSTSAVIDRINNTYTSLCTVTGCNHVRGNCENNLEKYFPVINDDKLYFCDRSKVYSRDSEGNVQEVFNNTFSTEWSRESYAGCPGMIVGMIFINEKEMLLAGANFYLIYDMEAKEITEPVILPEGDSSTFCYIDDKVFTNMDNSLYRTDLITGTTECVSEQGYRVRVVGERIWYCKWENGICSIYSNNIEFNDEKLEAEDGYVEYYSNDGMVVYGDNKRKQYYLRKSDGETINIFNIDDLEYDYEKLPEIYQNEEVLDKSNRKVESIEIIYCEDEDIYFTASYRVSAPQLNIQGWYWNAYYKVDGEGKITEIKDFVQSITE